MKSGKRKSGEGDGGVEDEGREEKERRRERAMPGLSHRNVPYPADF